MNSVAVARASLVRGLLAAQSASLGILTQSQRRYAPEPPVPVLGADGGFWILDPSGDVRDNEDVKTYEGFSSIVFTRGFGLLTPYRPYRWRWGH